MGNTQHADSQRQAGIALEVCVIMPSPLQAMRSTYFSLYAYRSLPLLIDLLAKKNIRDARKSQARQYALRLQNSRFQTFSEGAKGRKRDPRV